MCKVQMLRAFVSQRLTAAVEEIFVLVERTIAEYEEELSRTKEENERQRQLLDTVFKKPHPVLYSADVSEEDFPTKQQEWSSRVEQGEPRRFHIKEEKEETQPLHIKEEEEDPSQEELEGLEQFPAIGIVVKCEDDEDKDQSEKKRKVEPSSSSSTQHVTTEADGDRCVGSQADRLLASLSDSDDTTSHYPDTDDEEPKAEMTRHSDNTSRKCSECDKTFYDRSTLKRHMRSHTGEKPFMCAFCGKRFSLKANLKMHTQIHTGEKPFSCSVCGVGFVRSQHLKRHMRTHTGEKTYSCSSCNKTFCERTTLVVHMRKHTGEKVFSCSVCDEKFSYKYQVNNHKCAGENSSGK
ncbi:zinc finger protein 287-like [Dunckerocampus dactyliophorus]|uniref:zinc finger protein 287-like n=1 Tax=Dunckerocampus dactyliophorus TaxID=161453 RepID=UPI002404B427|nr:zinc finger protein 287-like [Dunckerocampus dactyliophorus]XP_054653568.1 zinc finger protein 287-like [Dunckerocampus dactyliophorus]XP_054653570.1 zinc finger protein 287-like [Dunckerocampus dactyliophorus]XP_054653571.1 zinc finger protein 287-like [Dunckerocampus dactyliophorus]